MLAPPLPRKSTKRLARDVFDTFTFSVYIYDITKMGHTVALLTVVFSHHSNGEF